MAITSTATAGRTLDPDTQRHHAEAFARLGRINSSLQQLLSDFAKKGGKAASET